MRKREASYLESKPCLELCLRAHQLFAEEGRAASACTVTLRKTGWHSQLLVLMLGVVLVQTVGHQSSSTFTSHRSPSTSNPPRERRLHPSSLHCARQTPGGCAPSLQGK